MAKRLRKDTASQVSGSATFIEDLDLAGQVHVSFLRSPVAHARVSRVDTSAAARAEGVLAVFTQRDLRGLVRPSVWREFPLASEEVLYQGQPVVAVVGSDARASEDALQYVDVDYEPLPAVSRAADAASSGERWLSTAPSNVLLRLNRRTGRPVDALTRSPNTLVLRLQLPRISPYPIEGRGVAIEPHRHGAVVYSSTQSPNQVRQLLLNATEGSRDIRVIQTAVGGAFGGKLFPGAEDLACYLISVKLRRSVKWVPRPEEKLVTLTHRPNQTHDVRVGYDAAGRIISFRDDVLIDAGAYYGGAAGRSLAAPGMETLHNLTAIDQMVSMATGPYDIRHVDVRVTAVATNKVMMGPIRGSGGMIATYVLERIVNQVALRLGLDQFSVREANLVDEVPRAGSPSGMGDLRFRDLLAAARSSTATRRLVAQARRRRNGRLAGVGVSFYVAESAPPSTETVRLELTTKRRLILFVGVAPTGQGSETTLADMVSRRLHIPSGNVDVRFGDTATDHQGAGTLSSRSITYAGSAALLACDLLVRRISERIGRAGDDRSTHVVFRRGVFHIESGDGGRRDLDLLDAADEIGATGVDATYTSTTPTFSPGCHISLVEVDRSTGSVRVLRHLTYDDFGNVLDRSALIAQTEGSVLQSIGEAFQEEVRYDPGCELDGPYNVPSFRDAPAFSHRLLRLTTSQHVHGGRGAGETGRIGSLPAIVNAVETAISDAVDNIVFLPSTPISPESVLRALSNRQGLGRSTQVPGC